MTKEREMLKAMLGQARRVVFFGGAGVSTESGIPDFRSAHGLYRQSQGMSYEDMLSIEYFTAQPDAFWRFYREVMLYPDAKPNTAHAALARLEKQGRLKAVLTQNIDGLHQLAGSGNVLELHGTVLSNSCTRCGKHYSLDAVLRKKGTPRCDDCDGLLRPDIVLYGEPLDEDVLRRAINAVRDCDLLIVGGTSLVVHPAAGLIGYRMPSCKLALINRDATPYDSSADLVIHENIAEVLDTAIE